MTGIWKFLTKWNAQIFSLFLQRQFDVVYLCFKINQINLSLLYFKSGQKHVLNKLFKYLLYLDSRTTHKLETVSLVKKG